MSFWSEILSGIVTAESNIRGADDDDLKNISDEIATSESNIRGTDSDDLKAISDQLDGLGGGSPIVIPGACDSGMTASTTTIVSDDLSGYGDDYFNNNWWMQVVKNNNSVGNAPSGELQRITDYTSSTGTFTTEAFSANVEEDDSILVIHGSQVQKDYQKYTSGSGNWTVPEGIYEVDVIIVAGGGSGGKDASPPYAGGGGGGEIVILKRHPVTPGASVAYVVGAGGAAKTSDGAGLDGGNSSFDGIIAHGGQLGANTGSTGGSGGHYGYYGNKNPHSLTGGLSEANHYIEGSNEETPINARMGSVINGIYKTRIGGGGGVRNALIEEYNAADCLGIGGLGDSGDNGMGGGGASWGDGGSGGSTGESGTDGGGGGGSSSGDSGAGGDGFVKIMWKG